MYTMVVLSPGSYTDVTRLLAGLATHVIMYSVHELLSLISLANKTYYWLHMIKVLCTYTSPFHMEFYTVALRM